VDFFAGDAVEGFHAVAHGVNVRVGGLHVFIDFNAAKLADFQPGFFGQCDVGTDTDGYNGQLAGKLRSVLQFHRCEFSVFTQESGYAVFGDDVGAFAPHMVFHQLGQFPVQKRQQLRKQFNDGDFNTRQLQRFAGFDTDESAADDHGLFDFAFIADVTQKIGVLHGL